MKKINIWYWTFTALFVVLMTLSSIPDVLLQEEAVEFMSTLGYPAYFVRFIGIAKLLGCLAILIPGFIKLKEWAYAGLFFDLIGAVYSMLAVSGWNIQMSFMLLPICTGILSYYFNSKRIQLKND